MEDLTVESALDKAEADMARINQIPDPNAFDDPDEDDEEEDDGK